MELFINSPVLPYLLVSLNSWLFPSSFARCLESFSASWHFIAICLFSGGISIFYFILFYFLFIHLFFSFYLYFVLEIERIH